MNELRTTLEVVNALGGNGPVAEITLSTPKAVSNWRGFETFPANTYVAMTAALRERGLSAPASLWGMKMPEAHAAAPESVSADIGG